MWDSKRVGGAACALAASAALGLFALTRPTPAGARAPQAGGDIRDYVAQRLDDFDGTMRIGFYDDNAGRKIGPDWGMVYKIKGDIRVRYKEENRLRMDSSAMKATFIINGTKQYVRAPRLGINTVMDLGESPGKRKTLLDVGMLSNGYLAYTTAEFRGMRAVDGVTCGVFKVSYRNKDLDTSHRMVWVNPQTKIVMKREEYSQTGKLNATFFYKDPKQVAPGVWFPSRVEAFNNQGEKAGVTDYKNIKVNQGLDDDLFKP